MEIKDIFKNLGGVIRDSVSNIDEWEKAILYVKKLEGSTSFESAYVNCEGKEVEIDTVVSYFTHKDILRLYEITQTEFPIHKNWNKAILELTPDNKFNIEYIWDQELQDEVDGYNKELS